MKTKILFSALVVLLSLGACKTQNKNNTNNMKADNSKSSLDWAGSYKGMLPCADCEGIETVIELNNDDTYKMWMRYSGKGEQIFEESGKFSWDKNGQRVNLEGGSDGPNYYLVGENQLISLDKKGNKITGNLADNYILRKVKPELREKYWKLVELNGNKIDTTGLMREPHLILSNEQGRFSANGGCNNMMGSYSIDNDKISFSKMASTMMACPNMNLEREFANTLETVKTYNMEGEKLVLSDGSSVPVARFEIVYLR